MRCYLPLLLCGLLWIGCSENQGQVAQGPNETETAGDVEQGTAGKPAEAAVAGRRFGEWIIGEPVQHENLTIFPISSRVAKNEDRFLTLDEGLRSGLVEIVEVGPSAAMQELPEVPQGNPVEVDNVDPFSEAIPSEPSEPAANDDPFGAAATNDSHSVATAEVSGAHIIPETVRTDVIPTGIQRYLVPSDSTGADGETVVAQSCWSSVEEETTLVAQIETDDASEKSNQQEREQTTEETLEFEEGDGAFLNEVAEQHRILHSGSGSYFQINEIAEGTPPEPVDEDLIQHGLAADPFASDEEQGIYNDPFAGGGGRAQVNRLMVWNKSDRPLFLMPGEVISGGQQDRTIGSEIVLQPSDKPVPVDAFCVESGRWADRSVDDTAEILSVVQRYGGAVAATETDEPSTAEQAADDAGEEPSHVALAARLEQPQPPAGAAQVESYPANLSLVVSQTQTVRDHDELIVAAGQANAGKFVGSVGLANKSVRMAVQIPVLVCPSRSEQGAVWDAVEKVNAKTGNAIRSNNFSGNYGNAEIAGRLKPYLDACAEEIAQRPQVIGVVVAIDGRIETADLFESTPLFLKLWPKLLKSYALDASIAGVEVTERVRLSDDPFGQDTSEPTDGVAATSAAAETSADKTPAKERKICTVDDCQTFLKQLTDAKPGKVELAGGLLQSKHEGQHMVILSVSDPNQNLSEASYQVDAETAAPADAHGGFSERVHTGAFSK